MSNSTWFNGGVTLAVPSNTTAISYNFTSNSALTAASSLLVTQSSLYWHHLSVGVPSSYTTYYRLNGVNYITSINTTSSLLLDDMVTSDTLQWMPTNTALFVSNQEHVYSNGYQDTAWLGFQLDNRFSPLYAFHVANVNRTLNITQYAPVTYSSVLVNEGNVWNAVTNTFTAPATGSYFFAYSSQNQPQVGVSGVYIAVNGIKHHFIALNILLVGVNVVRGSVMLSLAPSDQVQFRCYYEVTGSGTTNYAQGFYYSPITGPATAWSVTRSTGGGYMGSFDPFTFNNVEVNVGGAWNSTTNQVQIVVSGTYVVDLTTYLCTKSFCPGSNGDMAMSVQRLNNNAIIALHLSIFNVGTNCLSRSRMTIVQLYAGDYLRVTASANACF